jgi:hypothetical protein
MPWYYRRDGRKASHRRGPAPACQHRAALAGELLASLDDSELDPDREAAWITEIRDRIDAYERGDVTAVPVDQALAQIRAVRVKAT